MPDIKFTPSQKSAIEHTGANLLVSAAAGSGKTAVVARRAVMLVAKHKVPINKLLLITFTKAAAAEMRERVGSVLKEMLSENYDPFLYEQLRFLPDADICTIDSYLSRFLKRHSHAVDIDPAFTIASEDEKQNLSHKTLKNLIDEEFESHQNDFLFMCDTLCLRKMGNISELISCAYEYARKHLDYREFVQSWGQFYTMDEASTKNSRWMNECLKALQFDFVYAKASLETALKYASFPQGPSNYIETLEDEIKQLEKLISCEGYDDTLSALNSITFKRLPSKDKDSDETYAKMAVKLRNDAKKKIESIKKSTAFMPLKEIINRHSKMAPALSALSRIVLEYDKKISREKSRRKLLDFADLMHYALAALKNPSVKEEEQARYDYVFVDEYQDTNRLQEKLIGSIAKGDNLFCVGDVKQSIYSFRQAEPALFTERLSKSSPDFKGADHLIALSENFRSSKAVVDFVNLVFYDVMTRKTGGIDYTGSERLIKRANRPDGEYPGASAELYIIDTQQKRSEDSFSGIEYEAILAADKIKETVGQTIYDGKLGSFRPAKYSDICILSRSFKPIVRPVRRILEQKGIPVSPIGESGYLDMLEVEIATNILKIIDNHHRDIALISAMNSPAFGFEVQELIDIRKACTEIKAPFYRAAELYTENRSDSLAQKLSKFFKKIKHFRLMSKHMPLGEFIWYILSDTMLYDAVGALPGGRVRQQNLKLLAERGDLFATTPGRNLSQFLEHLANVKDSDMDFEAAADESALDSVKFMSIHKSKGLEFPVVILINTDSNSASNSSTVIFTDGLPPGVKSYDPENMTKRTTLAYESSSYAKNYIENAEKLRILYVAMTRARERLIMIGSIGKSIESRINQWLLPKKGELLFNKSFMDILASSAIRVKGSHISSEADEILLDNIISKIIPADSLVHKKSKRKDAVLDAIEDARKFPYPVNAFESSYITQEYLPAKTTATALIDSKISKYEFDDFVDVPDFMREETKLSPSDIGSFTHKLMQFIDINKGENNLPKKLDELIEKNMLPEQAREHVNLSLIERFLKSDIYIRALNSSFKKQEMPFVIKLPASNAFDNIDSSEPVLVQGIIDLCFIEDDQWVLVDYKTNHIPNAQRKSELLTHYKKQIDIYKTALEMLTGKKVKQAGIYFLSSNDENPFCTV